MKPEEVLKRLDLLLKDKQPNGTYTVRKENRITIIQAELLIKKLLGYKNG